jgi:hypothetical protein
MIRHLTLLILFSFLCSCCKHPKPDDPKPPLPFRHCPKELLDYVIFQPGTYWVYEDSATGKFDSVWVTAFEHDTAYAQFLNDDRLQKGDEFHMLYKTSYFKEYNQLIIHLSYDIKSPDIYPSWSAVVFNTNIFGISGQGGLFTTPFPFNEVGQGALDPIDTLHFAPDYSELMIFSNFIDSVLYINHRLTSLKSTEEFGLGRRCKQYFRRNIGIVRYELPDSNQVWNLKRYNLIQ